MYKSRTRKPVRFQRFGKGTKTTRKIAAAQLISLRPTAPDPRHPDALGPSRDRSSSAASSSHEPNDQHDNEQSNHLLHTLLRRKSLFPVSVRRSLLLFSPVAPPGRAGECGKSRNERLRPTNGERPHRSIRETGKRIFSRRRSRDTVRYRTLFPNTTARPKEKPRRPERKEGVPTSRRHPPANAVRRTGRPPVESEPPARPAGRKTPCPTRPTASYRLSRIVSCKVPKYGRIFFHVFLLSEKPGPAPLFEE